jgi:2-isopropylmalate synthase
MRCCYGAAWQPGSDLLLKFSTPLPKPAVGFLFCQTRTPPHNLKTTMLNDPSKKYRPYPPVQLPDRQWPNRVLTRAPRWCSVDLRDGNQSLAVPMNVSQKLELFSTLVKCGFKEIEVGFPSASNTEFTFNRRLIEEHRAPEDVWLQVLVQAREDLIERTFESLVGAKKAIIHLYNSTSPAQRRVVFGMSKEQIVQVAVRGARLIQERLPQLQGTEVMLQ